MSARNAIIIGASGLVGAQVLTLLLNDPDYESVTALVRRPLGVTHPKLHQEIVDFDALDNAPVHQPATVAFCCLGTTIADAGSQAAFRKVDHDYVVASAHYALKAGAQIFLLVTAMGADARSSVFYNRVKGEAEAAVSAMPFKSVIIMRPSMIDGNRAVPRPGLAHLALLAMKPLAPLIPRAYRVIGADAIARAMIAFAAKNKGGVEIVQSDRLQDF